jgi:hypothetical protein
MRANMRENKVTPHVFHRTSTAHPHNFHNAAQLMSACRAVISFPKTCQRCGTEFACGGSCCWCDEIVLDASVRAALRERFTDCLCRACLEAAARVSAPDDPGSADL